MARRALDVDGPRQGVDQMRLAATGLAGNDKQALARRLFENRQQEISQRLVTAGNERDCHPTLRQPALGDMRALAATETIQARLRVRSNISPPATDQSLPRLATDEAMPQRQRRRPALFAVQRANLAALVIAQQRNVPACGKRPPGKLNRRAHIEQRHIPPENLRKIGLNQICWHNVVGNKGRNSVTARGT